MIVGQASPRVKRVSVRLWAQAQSETLLSPPDIQDLIEQHSGSLTNRPPPILIPAPVTRSIAGGVS